MIERTMGSSPQLIEIEPVRLARARECNVFSGMKIPHGTKTRTICKTCRYAKSNLIHHAFPASTRTWGSGGNRGAYQTENDAWQAIFLDLLEKSGLPTGLKRVSVEAEYTWPKKMRIDKDNFRYPCSKFLGDALQAGGYIEDDNWDEENRVWRFSFDEIIPSFEKGIEQMVLTIFAWA